VLAPSLLSKWNFTLHSASSKIQATPLTLNIKNLGNEHIKMIPFEEMACPIFHTCNFLHLSLLLSLLPWRTCKSRDLWEKFFWTQAIYADLRLSICFISNCFLRDNYIITDLTKNSMKWRRTLRIYCKTLDKLFLVVSFFLSHPFIMFCDLIRSSLGFICYLKLMHLWVRVGDVQWDFYGCKLV